MAEQTVSRFATVQGAGRSSAGRVVSAANYSEAYGPAAGFDTWYIVDAADVREGSQAFSGSVHGLPLNTVAVLFARVAKDHSKDAVFFVGGNADAMGPINKVGAGHVARKGECEWSAYVETFAGGLVTSPDGKTFARKLLTHIKGNAHPYGPESKAEIVCVDLATTYATWPMLAPKKVS